MDTCAIVTGLYYHHHHCYQDFEVKAKVLNGREDLMYMDLLPQITRVKVTKAVLTFSRFSHTFNMTLRWKCVSASLGILPDFTTCAIVIGHEDIIIIIIIVIKTLCWNWRCWHRPENLATCATDFKSKKSSFDIFHSILMHYSLLYPSFENKNVHLPCLLVLHYSANVKVSWLLPLVWFFFLPQLLPLTTKLFTILIVNKTLITYFLLLFLLDFTLSCLFWSFVYIFMLTG